MTLTPVPPRPPRADRVARIRHIRKARNIRARDERTATTERSLFRANSPLRRWLRAGTLREPQGRPEPSRRRTLCRTFARLFEAVHEGVYIGTISSDGALTIAANPISS
jgi:hypothetical protein